MSEPTTLLLISIDLLDPAEDNPRTDLGDLAGLASSIMEVGILEPIMVTPGAAPGRYTIIAGHRRHAAARLVNVAEVEVIVQAVDSDTDRQRMMLIENLRREDLTVLDKARGFKALADSGLSQRGIAGQVGISQATVSKALALLKLPEAAQALIADGQISQEDGVRFAALDAEKQVEVLEEDPADIADELDRIEQWQKAQQAAEATVREFTESGVEAYLGRTDSKAPEGMPRGSSPAYRMHWVRDHKKKACRAVVVRPRGYGDPQIEEWCTDPKKHPDPRVKKAPARSAGGKTKAAEDKAILAKLVDQLEVAAARRREFIATCPVPADRMVVFAEVIRAMRCDYARFDTHTFEALDIPTGGNVETVVGWVNTEDRFVALAWRSILFQLEENSDLQWKPWARSTSPADFGLDPTGARAIGDHRYLKLLEGVGYETTWIESKRAGLPYKEPQLPGTSSPATEEGASDAEESEFGPGPDPVENCLNRLDELNAHTPTISIAEKKGKQYINCSACGYVGFNTKLDTAEQRGQIHLKEKHGIEVAA